MDSALRQKKQSDYEQLTHHFKIYRQTYHNRPLPTRNIDTYLELARFVSRLAPTFLSHYSGSLEN
jgi:hypothetical protein